MHDDVQKLYMLLMIHEKLMGHPKLASLRKSIEEELGKFMFANLPVDTPAPVYPPDTVTIQTNTESEVPQSIRRV